MVPGTAPRNTFPQWSHWDQNPEVSFMNGPSRLKSRRYFPNVPEYAQSLRTSKNNRRAVNAATGKGAMMRRGATLAIQKLESSGLGAIATDIRKTKDFDAVVRDALRMRTF